MQKREPRKSLIPKGAIKELNRRNIDLKTKNWDKTKKIKYEKQKFYAEMVLGYDALENLMVVRQYVQARFGISFKLLEIILFLAPKQFFTQADYSVILRSYTYGRIQNILDTGYVKIFNLGRNKSKNLYTLSASGRFVVTEFYKCLFGEKKIPETYRENPLALKSADPFDKKKFEMIKQLNQLSASVTKRQFFE